jgi:hypothetical protein
MSRPIPNDVLATKARERANAAKPGSRERTLWNTVARALDSTTTAEAARTMLLGLAMPALRQDSARMLSRLVAGMKDDEKDD